jgi:glucosamine--fructose-6-phosphate aminotransferase (isomerizing)
LKEIYEQPDAVQETVNRNLEKIKILSDEKLKNTRILFLGMGSSYFASIYAKYILSKIPSIHINAISASEFLHYPFYIEHDSLIFPISQSGESAETVKVAKNLRKRGFEIFCITNSKDSSLSKLSDETLLTYAGEEKCSATKTFLSTIILIYLLSINLGIRENHLSEDYRNLAERNIYSVVKTMRERLGLWSRKCLEIAKISVKVNSIVILGRGYNVCTAFQGALLFKEISKIHAEGMDGGNFRHGPIELVSPNFLTISLASGFTKRLMFGIARDVEKLGGKNVIISDDKGAIRDGDILVNNISEKLSPLLFSVPLELIAYHSSILKGRDPDSLEHLSKITSIE